MIKIIPSILTNNPSEAKELLKRCEGVVDRVSVDIIDGKFADNKTIDPNVFIDFETDLKIDYQLMVEEPINWVEKCVRGQADRIIGHVERMHSQVEFVGKVQEVGVGVGLGLDLKTPVSAIDEGILTSLDVVLLMSVPAGFGGQKFDESVLAKIKELSKARENDNTPFKIQDDGGVTVAYINSLSAAGADEASVGRLLFDGDLADNMNRFQEEARKLATSY